MTQRTPFQKSGFQKKIQNELINSIKQTLVVSLLTGDLRYKGLLSFIINFWKHVGSYHIMDLENRFFAVKFSLASDYIHALFYGPWLWRGSYLIVQPGSPKFSTKQTLLTALATWLRPPELPFHYYNKTVVRYIGSLIGQSCSD